MSEPWTVPRCFEGGTVAVLASGESMSQSVADQVRDAGIPAIAINTTFRLVPWAWMLYAADIDWWRHRDYRDALDFVGLKASIVPKGCPPYPEKLLTLWNTGAGGLDDDPRCLRTGSNGGYQAMHIAVHAGARRILLCGFDMHGGHWHGDHPHGLKVNTRDGFEKFIARFGEVAPLLKKRGTEVVNCTPESELKCFPTGVLEDELENATC